MGLGAAGGGLSLRSTAGITIGSGVLESPVMSGCSRRSAWRVSSGTVVADRAPQAGELQGRLLGFRSRAGGRVRGEGCGTVDGRCRDHPPSGEDPLGDQQCGPGLGGGGFHGSLSTFFWEWAAFESAPLRAAPPALTGESTALAKELRSRGWTFVGPTTCYAFMQAMGLVNDHLEDCWVREEAEESRRRAAGGVLK